MIQLRPIDTFLGPNIHSSEPVMVVEIKADPADLQDTTGRMQRLTNICSNWFSFTRDPSSPNLDAVGAFLCQWTHALLNQTPGEIRTAKTIRINDTVQIILGHYHPQSTWHALRLAAQVFTDIDKLAPEALGKIVQQFWQSSLVYHPDFQAKILIDYAEKKNIPFRPHMPGTRTWQYGWGARSEIFFESSGPHDSSIGSRLSADKMVSKQLFARLGAPMAASVVVHKEEELTQAASTIGFPCVTKPLDRGRSVGVTTNLKSPAELLQGFRIARQQSQAGIMVEKYFEGEVHRIMVMQGKFWRIVRRNRPTVVGDGQFTIRQLAQQLIDASPKNRQPKDFVGPAPLDAEFHQSLAQQGLTAETILPKGSIARIRNIPLLSAGASYEDVTAQTHPDLRLMSEALCKGFGIANAGIDYITSDISQTCFGHGVFLEINLTPGLRVPLLAGIDADETARAVLGEIPAGLPLTLILAPKENLPELFSVKPKTPDVGWVVGQRYGIGSLEFPVPALNSFSAFDLIVRHKSVDKLWVVIDPADLAKQGLIAQRISQTFVLTNGNLDANWLNVIKKHSNAFYEMETLAQLLAKASTLAD